MSDQKAFELENERLEVIERLCTVAGPLHTNVDAGSQPGEGEASPIISDLYFVDPSHLL